MKAIHIQTDGCGMARGMILKGLGFRLPLWSYGFELRHLMSFESLQFYQVAEFQSGESGRISSISFLWKITKVTHGSHIFKRA